MTSHDVPGGSYCQSHRLLLRRTRHLSRRHVKGVKVSRQISIKRRWWPFARLPPARVFCAREGPAHPLGNVRPCHGPRSVGPRWLSLIFESGRRLYRLRLSSFRGKAWSGRGGDAFYPVRALTLSRRFRFIWNLLARLEMPCARAEKSFRNFTEMRAWHPLTLGGSVT